MKPGDLVRIELPERVWGLSPYNTWNNRFAVIVEESQLAAVHKTWVVLVNGMARDIGENYLRRIDETR
jgi:hypothetical protein